jgi:hypothetical protein
MSSLDVPSRYSIQPVEGRIEISNCSMATRGFVPEMA